MTMGLIGCPETPVSANQRCVTSHKSEDPSYVLFKQVVHLLKFGESRAIKKAPWYFKSIL